MRLRAMAKAFFRCIQYLLPIRLDLDAESEGEEYLPKRQGHIAEQRVLRPVQC